MEDKPINWIGTSRDDVCSFPEAARRKTGVQLRAVQRGEMPTDFKPMSTVGKGAAFLFGGSPRIKKRQDSSRNPYSHRRCLQGFLCSAV
jgi:phage-related protein